MKVRNGFVSNSSSSSFIISKDAYEDVFDLAKVMICHRGHDDSGDFYVESNKKLCEILNDEKSRGRDPNIGVTFPSCNFDTYIVRLKNGEFAINTCNNHRFYEILDGVLTDSDDEDGYLPEELKKYWEKIWEMDLESVYDFFFPSHGVIGRRFALCQECCSSIIILKKNGKEVCLNCDMKDEYRDIIVVEEEIITDEDKKIIAKFGRTFRKLNIRC